MTYTPERVTVPTSPSDPAYGPHPWPEKIVKNGFYPHQLMAAEQILNHYNSGVDVVILDAPVGSGKSFLAEMVRRLLNSTHTVYAPDTKNLQAQLMNDFGAYAKLLQGKANYPTYDLPEKFAGPAWQRISCADCTKKAVVLPACSECKTTSETRLPHCGYCHPVSKCPYLVAKRDALNADLAIVNSAYFIAEANSAAMMSGVDFVIFDEADTLPSVLANQVEVYFSAKRQAEFDLNPPEKKTVPESWQSWVTEHAIPVLQRHLHTTSVLLRTHDDIEIQRRERYLSEQLEKLHLLEKTLEDGNAIYDGYDYGAIRFQPVRVGPFGPKMIWSHAEKFLLMSGTFEPIGQFVEESGLEESGLKWEVVKVPNTFPKERRPIVVRHAADMSYKNKETAWPKMAAMVKRIVTERHAGDRVLVHCPSYEFTRYLTDELSNLERPIITYNDAAGRDDALGEYKRHYNAVMLAPSMDRGVDLPYDLCRAVILTKVPWPSLKDKRVQARRYSANGERWYVGEAVRKIVQGLGRGMRAQDDFCHSYILDSVFTSSIYKSHKGLLPEWVVEALDFTGGGL